MMVKITDVRTVLLTGPSTNDPFLREARQRRSVAFIEIVTDSEHIGLGETYAGYFLPEAVPQVVEFFRPILIGQTVDDIPTLWQRMYHCGNFWGRVGIGASILGGIEAGLWDLKGKLEGVPVHQLLGGSKYDRLPCYATGGPSNYPEDRLAAKIDHYLSLGFLGIKLGVGRAINGVHSVDDNPQQAAEFEARKIEFARNHAGEGIAFMLDGHMGNSATKTWKLETALAVAKALEPFQLTFLEEPLHYTDLDGYAALTAASRTPIAGGECLTAFCEWQTFIDRDCFHIGQPDASYLTGLGPFMEVASALDIRGRKIATHAWGAAGSLMQNIHCGFAAPNTAILEVAPDFGPLHSELLGDSFVMKDGFVLPPEQPGLGVRLTDDIKNRFPFVPGSGEFNSVPGKVLVG
ncbi:MAG: mandelate racemase/muconate lactonizing enzyme family protein [Acidobacteriota bacterium]